MRKIAWALLVILVLISLVLDVLIVALLYRARQEALRLTAQAAIELEALQGETIRYTFHFQDELPIAADVPFHEKLDVPIEAAIPISTTVSVEQTLEVPIQTLLGEIVVEVPLDVDIPVEMTVPIDLRVPVEISRTVTVSTVVPLDLEVPLAIPIAETPLADLLGKLQRALLDLQTQIQGGFPFFSYIIPHSLSMSSSPTKKKRPRVASIVAVGF
jgi:hypothetical protein